MNKLDKLTQKWNEAKEKVDTARDDIENYLVPIIKILYPGRPMYTLSSIRDAGNEYRIETIDSRDNDNWRDFSIPFEVINAKDPVKAALALANKWAADEEVKKQAQIKAEIVRLQGLLDNPPKGIVGL